MHVGGAVLDRRYPGCHCQCAVSQQPERQCLARSSSIRFLAVPGFWVGMLIVLGRCSGSATARRWPTCRCLPIRWRTCRSSSGRPSCWVWDRRPISRAWRARSLLRGGSRGLRPHRPRQGTQRTPVISLHALPNALLPVITLSGILLGFGWPGRSPWTRVRHARPRLRHVHRRSSERDVFVMQNLVFLYAVVFVLLEHPGRPYHCVAGSEDSLSMSVTQPDTTFPAQPGFAGRRGLAGCGAAGAALRMFARRIADVGGVGLHRGRHHLHGYRGTGSGARTSH